MLAVVRDWSEFEVARQVCLDSLSRVLFFISFFFPVLTVVDSFNGSRNPIGRIHIFTSERCGREIAMTDA